jgi:hypothetical protein
MAPDASTRYCAACGVSATLDANYCIACGQPLQARPSLRSLAPVRIVEAEVPEPDEPGLPTQASETALAAQGAQGERPGALAALPRLAALAWRQPAVRSVVTTGASAVALSLVWRVAGAALTGGKARRALLPDGESLAPMVGDLLRGATPGKRLRRRGRRGEVVEEVIYMRRVFRR